MMIEFLKTGNFEYIMVFVLVILLMLFLEILAVCVDFWSGTNMAKALEQKLYSNGFRLLFLRLNTFSIGGRFFYYTWALGRNIRIMY